MELFAHQNEPLSSQVGRTLTINQSNAHFPWSAQ